MDGLIIVNKPKDCTSHDVVRKVKKIFNEKVGHTGTLDPMATGVLPLLVGKGTLCSKYLIDHNKEYRAKIELGKKTTTGDTSGEIVEEKKVESLEIENVKNVLNSFVGKQSQVPPMYSAIKVNGKKLYEYARRGEKVEVKPRKIEIYKIELLEISKNEIEFKVSCSKGTYIRTLCEDIAKKLGTVGTMSALERTKVGTFSIEEAVDIDKINESKIITIEKLFENAPKINLENRKLKLFLNGVRLTNMQEEGVYRVYSNNIFIGLGTIKNKLLKRDVIIENHL